MVPQPLSPSKTLRRATACLCQAVGQCVFSPRDTRNPHVFNPRSRVCGVSLVVKSRGSMCVMLTGADSRKIATAEVGNREEGVVCPLSALSGPTEKQLQDPLKKLCPKERKADKPRNDRAFLYTSTRPALSDCVFRKKSGRETAEIREANLPAPSPPPAKPPLCLKSEREVRQESKDRETSEVFALAFARGAVIIFNTL